MSAIAGIISLNQEPISSHWIEKLTSAMASRGPDGRHHWQNKHVALGHCLLRNTPESMVDKQPLVSRDGSLVSVFDGRLDNRRELIEALAADGHMSTASCDAELIIAAYKHWSEDCPAYLLGDFSFAIWDVRQNKLFCAKDHVGARQFYYVCNNRFFAFASHDEALLGLPGISGQPDNDLIAHFLVPGFNDLDPQKNWYEGVQILLPAHFLTVTPEGMRQPRNYWQFKLGEVDSYSSDNECQEAFLQVFRQAVQSRTRSTTEPALMLSGGMDSAGISAMLELLYSETPNGTYHTYSAISDDISSSLESRCIQSMVQSEHVSANFLSVPSFKGMIGLDDLAANAWPNAHPVDNSILLPAMMCQAASRDGNRIMLHGVSGDLTMGDFPRYIAPLIRSGQWATAWRECKCAARNSTYLKDNSPLKLLLQNSWTAFMPLKFRQSWSQIRVGFSRPSPRIELLNREFLNNNNLLERLRMPLKRPNPRLEPGSRISHAASIFDSPGVASGLSGFQRVAARFGVELRDPWADKRVLDFFLHLPLQQLVRNGWTKYLARSAFSELEQRIRWRSDKEHLGHLFTSRLMQESSDLVAHSINDDLDILEFLIDPNSVRDAYSLYLSSKGIYYTHLIFDIVTLIRWVKRVSIQGH